MNRFRGLKARILLLLLGGLAVPVIALGLFFFNHLVENETTRRAQDHLRNFAVATIRQIDGLLDRAAAAVRIIAADEGLARGLREPGADAERSAKVAARLDVLVAGEGLFELAVVCDRDLKIVGVNGRTPFPSQLDLTKASALLGRSLRELGSDGEWARRAVSRETDPDCHVVKVDWGQSSLAGLLETPEMETTYRDYRYFVRYAAPVESGGEVVGAVGCYLPWRHIQADILDGVVGELDESFGTKAERSTGYAFMFGRDHRTIIGHRERERYGQDLVKDYKLESLAAAVDLGARSHEYEFPAGKPKIAGLAYSATPAGFGWVLGLGVYNHFIFENIYKLAVGYAIGVIALCMIASYFALRMTRRFRLSVDQLIQTAGRVARGEMPGTVRVETKDEIGSLAEAFNQMAETLRKRFKSSESIEKPFREIRPNPFIFGNPIKTKDMFYGRRAEFTFAKEMLSRSQGGLVLVFCGERRSGKTSILWQIRNGELGDGFVPVFVDLQALSAVSSQDEFYEGLALEIAEAVPGGSAVPYKTDGGGSPQAFKTFLQGILRHIGRRRLVILFDEYETIDGLIDKGTLEPQVVPFLASFAEAEPPTSFVFSGSRSLEQNESQHWAPLVAKSQSLPIGLLSREDALALIQEPVEDRVEYDFGIPGGIVRLTGGHAYYTQVVCQNLVDHLNRARHNSCDARDLAAVVDEIIQSPPPQMVYFWKQRDASERLVLAILAEILEDDGATADARDIVARSTEYPIDKPLTERIVNGILRHFAAEDLIEEPEPGRFRFRIDLFRIRIKRGHAVWQILKEEPRPA